MLSSGSEKQLADLGAHGATAVAEDKARLDYLSLANRISDRLAQQYPTLTHRERTVCGFTLAGYTAEGISLILGVGISTIVTYRRRAYARLGVSNVNQLIAPLLV